MRAIFVVGLLVIGVLSAQADDLPWAAGVSDGQKATAKELLGQGNALFLDKKFAEALAVYEQAIAQWDHPAIRFNMVRALIQLSKPVEAYENLVKALRYGKAPLDDALYIEALSYKTLLQGQIAEVAVTCDQPDVDVTLDGQPLLACPGQQGRKLPPGRHQVVARKKGFLTLTKDLVVLPANQEIVPLELKPVESAAIVRRRWTWWRPWLVIGGGGTVSAIGGLLLWKSSSDFDAYDRAIAMQCGDRGCAIGDVFGPTRSLHARARLENQVGVAAIAVGGAALVTGAVLAYLNRGQVEYPDEYGRSALAIVPTSGGASVTWSARY